MSAVNFLTPVETRSIGTPRPLWRVILLSSVTLLLYYGWYKWIIQEELRRHNGYGWSGTLCLLPFVLGVAVPQALRIFDPDVPDSFGWFSLLGIVWIYIVQFRLYRTVNRLYVEAGMKAPLTIWWIAVPGLNLVVGLRQIHFLSQYWAQQQGAQQQGAQQQEIELQDPIANFFPLLSKN